MTTSPDDDDRSYDAIVIGAGMAGMCATARLTASGLKVCLIERSGQLGGRASHRVRADCVVTTGAIMIPMGPNSNIRGAFDALDVEMDMIETTGKLRYRLDHGDYDLPEGGGGLLGMIDFAFQGDKDAAKALYRQFIKAMTGWTPLDTVTMREWLDQYTANAEIKALFNGYTAALMGIGIHELRAGEFFRFLKDSSKGSRFGLAAHGNGALMDSLASAIEASGSTILRRSTVHEILVDEGSVMGVLLASDGTSHDATTTISAPIVLSNAGPDRTVELAGGDQNFEASYIERLHTDSHEATIFHVTFTMDRPLVSDLDGSMVIGNTTNLIYLEIPSNISPFVAPPGVHLHTAYGAPADSANVDYKGELENTIIELDEQFPGVIDEATFLVKAMHRGNSPGMHRWAGFTMPVDTPIQGLYSIGDGSAGPGTIGTEGAATSAKLAVDHVLSRR